MMTYSDALPARARGAERRARVVTLPRAPLREATIASVVFVVATAIAWFRLPGLARGTFWAEDAQVFSARALGQAATPWGVFSSYDGYVHAVPQTVADLIWAVVPVSFAAVTFTLAACVIAGVVAVIIYLVSASWVRSVTARLLLAAITVCAPGLAYETLGNLANVHWFLLWLTPFLFLARPRAWWSAALVALAGLFVVATEVQAVLFAPMLLVRLRDRKRWPLIAAVGLGISIQGLAVIGGGRTTGTGLPSLASVLHGYVLQVPLLAMTGSGEAASAAVGFSGWALAWAALLPFVASLAAVVYLRRLSVSTLGATYLAGASVIIWSAGYALNRSSAFDFSAVETGVLIGGVPLLRYAVVPLMLLLGVVVIMIDALVDNRERTASVVATIVLMAVFIGGFTSTVASPRSGGPTWQEGLRAAAGACATGSSVVFEVRTAPLYGTWTLPLPCDRLNSREVR